MRRLQNLIEGRLSPPAGGAYLDNVEPATGTALSRVPDSDERDVAAAVAAAVRARDAWRRTPAATRSRLLLRVADRIDAALDELAELESRDSGKPLRLAREIDIPRASANFRFFATAILHGATEAHETDEAALNVTLRRPLGVAGCISPWNLPLYLFTWKIAPALAAGNAVVAKPSELTPETAGRLSELCLEADLPPGVLNIVHGLGARAGAALVAHPEVPAVSFTGGTRTGAEIARVAAPMFKRLSLELGGKNPTIVFADCRFDEAVATAVRAAFTNQGEICLCGSRVLVERAIYERFRDAFVERTRGLLVGDPLDPGTDLGALVSRDHMDKVLSYVALARDEGGTILCGGERVRLEGRCAGGSFVAPTVIEGLPATCRTNQEEIFGPVVTLLPFDGEDEALAIANGTSYGLAASLWTGDLRRAQRMARELDSGIVWVNCWMLRDLRTPFGGTKGSGVGREGGLEALRFFTETTNVCFKY